MIYSSGSIYSVLDAGRTVEQSFRAKNIEPLMCSQKRHYTPKP